jgi:hypothetical protein
LCIIFATKMVGQHFGDFFQKLIWSPWFGNPDFGDFFKNSSGRPDLETLILATFFKNSFGHPDLGTLILATFFSKTNLVDLIWFWRHIDFGLLVTTFVHA